MNFRISEGPYGFKSGLSFTCCPHCKASDGGLIYAQGLLNPVTCRSCMWERLAAKERSPEEESSRQAKWKVFVNEIQENQDRWDAERKAKV